MTGLREQKKSEIRNRILDVSRDAFLNNGYDNTSTKEIAKQSGIGAGTLFNYFPTKADILIELLFFELDSKHLKQDLHFKDATSAVDVIYEFVITTISPVLKIPTRLLRDFGLALLTLAKKSDNMLQKITETDMSAIAKLEILIDRMKTVELIDKSKDTKQISRLIYTEIFFDMALYAYNENFSKEDLQYHLKASLVYLIE